MLLTNDSPAFIVFTAEYNECFDTHPFLFVSKLYIKLLVKTNNPWLKDAHHINDCNTHRQSI